MLKYFSVYDSGELPELQDLAPYKCVVIISNEVSTDRQHAVSQLLAETGCRYMMAWGKNCTTWDDCVDNASLERSGWGPVPDTDFIMTTWHDNETLEDVLWFAKHAAVVENVKHYQTVVLEIGGERHRDTIDRLYSSL